ncbi:MAG: aminoglycoside phosphotransferase [Betaproteobacteria bacterium]|nr:aminoglycoside phosphotransferase [Betaproteobacteria bacterium]
MSPALSSVDRRFDELRVWVSESLAALHATSGVTPEATFERASEDASFRRYFRVRANGATWIAMDAPPEREDCAPFIKVAALMLEAGMHVPQVLAQDPERGYLLLTDLGTTTYLKAIDEQNADALFNDAIDALIKWQLASRPGVLPPYDQALLTRELELFPEWYLGRHLGAPPEPRQRELLDRVFCKLVSSALAQPCVYVHRDYMPRNLMLSTPNPGVLDFQDAVYGPITYDVVSLFRDAFLSWPEERALDWAVRYWERAKRAGLPVGDDFGAFYRDFEWMGLQRHIKVLGIFARIHYRDGKPGYLEDTPRFLAYARHVAERYAELRELTTLLDEIEARAPQTAYSF